MTSNETAQRTLDSIFARGTVTRAQLEAKAKASEYKPIDLEKASRGSGAVAGRTLDSIFAKSEDGQPTTATIAQRQAMALRAEVVRRIV